MLRRPLLLAALLASLTGCADDESACAPSGCGPEQTFVHMSFAGASGFYGSPFPSDTRTLIDGSVDLRGFPNPGDNPLVEKTLSLLDGTVGFGLTSGVFFSLSSALDAQGLPSLHDSVEESSTVVLINVDEGSPGYLKRHPISVGFLADGGPFGSANLLAIVPLQGLPLSANTRYAAVVKTSQRDARGAALATSPAVATLASGGQPEGFTEAARSHYAEALQALAEAGIAEADIAGLAVFTTGEPAMGLDRVIGAMRSAPLPVLSSPLVPNEVFDDFCVYEATVPMPVYQEGSPPYADVGGGWVFDAEGAPVLQRMEEANVVVTVPRRAMPPLGYPVVVLSRTGAGGERPLVDRGVEAIHGGPPLAPGTGPALTFARAGFAGVSIDGPHGGLRNITHGDEQFLMFNVGNPIALRDNVRQSAAELSLAREVVASLSVDTQGCPGASPLSHFDPETTALMGHSMGATIAPLTMAADEGYKALLLSGAGGSFIENVLYKKSPLPVKGIAEVLLGLAGSGYSLSEHDPMMSLFQWATEPSDPPAYNAATVRGKDGKRPRHVLMLQGIVDTYILPPIANAASLSLGLDLAGPELGRDDPRLSGMTPLSDLLDLAGGRAIDLPASGNISTDGGAATAVVVQHKEDGVEDGHEVVFQLEAPKHQYRCFLEALGAGAIPFVPTSGGELDPCP